MMLSEKKPRRRKYYFIHVLNMKKQGKNKNNETSKLLSGLTMEEPLPEGKRGTGCRRN